MNSHYVFLCTMNLFVAFIGTLALVGGAFSWSTIVLTVANLFIFFCIVRMTIKKYKT